MKLSKPWTPKIMHKIIWQWKRNKLQNIWMLIYWVCFPLHGTCRGNRVFTTCAVKNDLGSGIHTETDWIWIAISMLCRPHYKTKNVCVFKTKILQFQMWPKDVSSVVDLNDLKNELNRSKQQEQRICCPDTVWLFKWKEVNRISKE